MVFPQYALFVLFYVYPKFRKHSSITSQEIANYISNALSVALSVYKCVYSGLCEFVYVLMNAFGM